MNIVKVSIIIPVYNVEKFLVQCLDSVIGQSLKDIEIICVNDGSTDNSLQILEDYADKDDRIKIIDKKNAGLGAARNTGLEYVTGEYVGFVDSDDWVDKNMFKKLYENAKFHSSDIVMCPMTVVNEGKQPLDNKYYEYCSLKCFNEDFYNIPFNSKETRDIIFKIAVNAYNKIYKTEFLNQINAKFPEGLIFEDNPFFYQTFLNAKKVSLIKDSLYFHRINRMDSITSKPNKKFFDILKITDLNIEVFSTLQIYKDFKIELLNRKITGIISKFNEISEIHREEFFKLIKTEFDQMNLINDDIEHLDLYSKINYERIINSYTYREYELNKEKEILLNKLNELTTQIKDLTENNRLKHDNNKLKYDYNKLKEDNNKIISENDNLLKLLHIKKSEISEISNTIRSHDMYQ